MVRRAAAGLVAAVVWCAAALASAETGSPALIFAAADSGRLPPLLEAVDRLAATPQASATTALAVLLAPWWEGEILSTALRAAPPALQDSIRDAVAAALKQGDHPAVTQARQWLEADRLAPFPPPLARAATHSPGPHDPAPSPPAENFPDPAWYYQKLLDDYLRRTGQDPGPRPQDPDDVPSPS